jgi:hypothetical protein
MHLSDESSYDLQSLHRATNLEKLSRSSPIRKCAMCRYWVVSVPICEAIPDPSLAREIAPVGRSVFSQIAIDEATLVNSKARFTNGRCRSLQSLTPFSGGKRQASYNCTCPVLRTAVIAMSSLSAPACTWQGQGSQVRIDESLFILTRGCFS